MPTFLIAAVSMLENQITTWDIRPDTGTKAMLLQPFSPVVVAADENEPMSGSIEPLICDYFSCENKCRYSCSSDGNIQIWKDYRQNGRQKLVTAFSSIQGHKPSARSVNAVVDWRQFTDYLYASWGDIIHYGSGSGQRGRINAIYSSPDSSISA